MQQGYVYALVEPEGGNFDPDFRPGLTLAEMLKLGVFGGKYLTDCRHEFPASWFKGAKLSPETSNPALNFFGSVAPTASPKRIVRDGENFVLLDGTRVAADEKGGFRLPNGAYVAALADGSCFVTAGGACRTSDPIVWHLTAASSMRASWTVTTAAQGPQATCRRCQIVSLEVASGTSLLRIPLTLVNSLTELAARLLWNFAARTLGHSLWEGRVPSLVRKTLGSEPKAVGNSGQGEAFKWCLAEEEYLS
jgi:hypothetical protein